MASVTKVNPKVAEKVMLKAGLKPLKPYKNARTKWKCIHIECGKIVYPRYKHIKGGGFGCSDCAYKKKGLKHKVAEKVMRKAGLKPLEKYKNSKSKWKCKCLRCGKTVFPTYQSIDRGRGGCRDCGFDIGSAKRKNNEADAIKIMLQAGLKPLEPYKTIRTKWKSTCLKCGRTVFPIYSNIQKGHTCAYCSDRKVDIKDVIRIMREAKLKPLEKYKNSKSKWKCKCLRCGKTVTPAYQDILQGQGGCRYCAPKGINMNVPSYIYLITNYELYSHKIGMGNHKKLRSDDRLGNFTKRGWQTYKVWQMKTGAEAIDIEAKIFKIIRNDLKIPVHLSKEQMPVIRGETETINADTITLFELEKIIEKVIKGYRNNP